MAEGGGFVFSMCCCGPPAEYFEFVAAFVYSSPDYGFEDGLRGVMGVSSLYTNPNNPNSYDQYGELYGLADITSATVRYVAATVGCEYIWISSSGEHFRIAIDGAVQSGAASGSVSYSSARKPNAMNANTAIAPSIRTHTARLTYSEHDGYLTRHVTTAYAPFGLSGPTYRIRNEEATDSGSGSGLNTTSPATIFNATPLRSMVFSNSVLSPWVLCVEMPSAFPNSGAATRDVTYSIAKIDSSGVDYADETVVLSVTAYDGGPDSGLPSSHPNEYVLYGYWVRSWQADRTGRNWYIEEGHSMHDIGPGRYATGDARIVVNGDSAYAAREVSTVASSAYTTPVANYYNTNHGGNIPPGTWPPPLAGVVWPVNTTPWSSSRARRAPDDLITDQGQGDPSGNGLRWYEHYLLWGMAFEDVDPQGIDVDRGELADVLLCIRELSVGSNGVGAFDHVSDLTLHERARLEWWKGDTLLQRTWSHSRPAAGGVWQEPIHAQGYYAYVRMNLWHEAAVPTAPPAIALRRDGKKFAMANAGEITVAGVGQIVAEITNPGIITPGRDWNWMRWGSATSDIDGTLYPSL